MSKKGGIPDAWDDDWERAAAASTAAAANPGSKQAPPPPTKVSKAERRAQHAEQQKLLWNSAENPSRSYFLETQGVVPLKQEYKPPVQLLSRKPQGPTLARRGDVSNGMANMSLQDDEDDSEEEARKKREADFEMRQRQAKAAREEKQKKYAEARERIMGSNSASPAAGSRDNSQGRNERRRAPRSNGGQGSQPTSAGQSPSRNASGLFDPEDMGRRLPRPERVSTPQQEQLLRQPRGPDRSGRGGFGFAPRGGLSGA